MTWFDAVLMLLLFRRGRVVAPEGGFGYWLPTPIAVCVMSVSDLLGSTSTTVILASFAVSVALVVVGYFSMTRSLGRERGRDSYYALTALMGSIGVFGLSSASVSVSIVASIWMMAAYLYYVAGDPRLG